MLTVEFYERLQAQLAVGGVVVLNIEPNTMLFDSAMATLLRVFDEVDFFDAGGNVVAIAYQGPRRSLPQLFARAVQLQARFKFRYKLADLLTRRRFYTPDSSVEPLTDDFAPVNQLKAIERHNQRWD